MAADQRSDLPQLRLRYPPRYTLTLPLGATAAISADESPSRDSDVRADAVESLREAPASADSTLAATDPRWVLAVRTQQVMQGAILRASDRDRLLRIGRMMGLRPFDANLIIAVVQDRVRRGETIGSAAGLLSWITPAPSAPRPSRLQRAMMWAALILGGEAVLVGWLFYLG